MNSTNKWFIIPFVLICTLFSTSFATESDTLYLSTSGRIAYYWDFDVFDIASNPGAITVGDGFDFDGYRNFVRGYLTFDITELERDTTQFHLTGVDLVMYQRYSQGDGESSQFPVFGDTLGHYPCVIDHIEYGEFDISDWTAGDPGDDQTLASNIGTITETAEVGLRHLDVLSFVWDDIYHGRLLSQYRVRFTVDHDEDLFGDWLSFYTRVWPPDSFDSRLIFTWEPTTSIYHESTSPIIKSPSFHVYPNPFNTTINIQWASQVDPSLSVNIYNLAGTLIDQLSISEAINSNGRSVKWHSANSKISNLPSGLYIISGQGNNRIESVKVLYLK